MVCHDVDRQIKLAPSRELLEELGHIQSTLIFVDPYVAIEGLTC
jgi:hypothetical protein